MSWRKTIREDRFVVQGANGKDFKWEENEPRISALIKRYIDGVLSNFKALTVKEAVSEVYRIVTPEIEAMMPQDGVNGEKGGDGKNGSEWFIFDSKIDESIGNESDLCLIISTNKIYKKIDGEWVYQASFKSNRQLQSGGVTEQFVKDYVDIAMMSSSLVGSRSSPIEVVAGDGMAFDGQERVNHWWVVGSSGGSIVSADPQIRQAAFIGQRLKITGTSDADYVQFSDGTGLVTGGQTIRLSNNSVVIFEADSNLDWVLESSNGVF